MKNKLVTVTAALLAAGLACWGGYVFCTQVTLGEARELYALIPVYIILVLLGAFVVEIVHEGAHFLVGAICSMGVKIPKFRIFKSSSVDIFPKGAKCMRLRFILTAGAGLFFNLLLIVTGIIAFAVPSVPPLLGVVLPYAVYSFVVNAAPLEYASGKTDGLMVCEAITYGDSAKVMFAVLRIQGLVNAGTPLKDVDEAMLLDVPQLPEDDINFIILTQVRYEYYLAKGDDSTAYKYFLRYKDLIQYLPSEYKDGDTVSAHRARIRDKGEKKEEEDATAVSLEELQSQQGQAAETINRSQVSSGGAAAEAQPAEPKQADGKK